MALEYGERIDFARLRRVRLERCLAEMKRDAIDVLLLGRESNARYATGARRLWTAGVRAWAPGCVVVASTGRAHLLALADEGIPPETGRAGLYAPTWNPLVLADRVASLSGVATSSRIGVDGMTPLWRDLLSRFAPRAEMVDASAALRRARERKTADEIECIRTACAIAENALGAVAAEVRPGAHEADLAGVFAEACARLGVTTPGSSASFCATAREGSSGSVPSPCRGFSSRPLEEGDLVALDGTVLYAGYEGGAGTTRLCRARARDAGDAASGASAIFERADALLDALVRAARAGAPPDALLRAWKESGEPPPPFPIAHGLGLGVEPPLVGATRDASPGGALAADSVLSLQSWVWRSGIGGVLGRAVVRITDESPEVLSRSRSNLPRQSE
ncbi:MAG: aminopeptidase P family protein [Deltaproteobacteria bacterium]|nr:aminopeptidase P family protein [Deltaproteobacteria bacterium]